MSNNSPSKKMHSMQCILLYTFSFHNWCNIRASLSGPDNHVSREILRENCLAGHRFVCHGSQPFARIL